VVKVFAIHDPTLPLAAHKEKVEEIRKKLASAVNCLPFQRAVVRMYQTCLLLSLVHYFTAETLLELLMSSVDLKGSSSTLL
jgi:phosphoinositide-3-kinase regulatory subunit 4